MAEIKSVYRGNGLTELIVIDGGKKNVVEIKKKKSNKVTAFFFLAVVIIDLFAGLIVAPFTVESTAFYVAYWTQAIALCGLWIYANFCHRQKPPAGTDGFQGLKKFKG